MPTDAIIQLLGSLVICTLIYMAVAAVLTGVVPYSKLGVPEPIAVAVDAMEDMAQLERLVNRLAGGAQAAAPLSAWRAPVQLAQPIYTVPFVAPTESPAVAADVVPGYDVWSQRARWAPVWRGRGQLNRLARRGTGRAAD